MPLLKPWELQTLFERFDSNRDGRIDLDELRSMLRLVGVDPGRRELEKVLGVVSLDLENFAAMCEDAAGTGNQEGGSDGGDDGERELMEAFKVFDEDGDGFISSKELGRLLVKLGLWKEEDGDCMAMISKFDSNADGRLDFQEFKDMMHRSL
ncbi:Calcium-binding allergen Ole e 8 [Nymphaea thermarum]|nr:Calcium-binding allergen Ole e 8 [Nymphaea thermarum]